MRSFTEKEIEDIQTMYRNAKSPEKQLTILAQLHACRVADIRRVLFPQDVPAGENAKKHAGNWRSDIGPEKRRAAVAEVLQGASVSSVARKYGVSTTALSNWVRKEKDDYGLGARAPETQAIAEVLAGYSYKSMHFGGNGLVIVFTGTDNKGKQDIKLISADVENLRFLDEIC